MINLFVFLIVGCGLAYVGALVLLWYFQEQVVFQPPSARAAASPIEPAEQVRYRAADGVELRGYVLGNGANAATVMIAFHGNAELARWLIPWAAVVSRQTGVCILLAEYRGYDGLPGTPSYVASALDAQAALAYANDTLGIPSASKVYFGHSLGSAVATELAASHPPKALLLQSPFSSAREMSTRMLVPGLSTVWRIISRVHYDTIARVRSLAVPVSVAHGDKDVIVPVRMGRAVFDAALHKGELLIVRGAGHNDVASVGGAAYDAWMARGLGVGSELGAIPAATAGKRSAL